MTKMIHARDTISGKVGLVPAIYLTLPVLGDHLVEVDADAKDHEPKLHKPADAKEYTERRAVSRKMNESETTEKADVKPEVSLDSEVQ